MPTEGRPMEGGKKGAGPWPKNGGDSFGIVELRSGWSASLNTKAPLPPAQLQIKFSLYLHRVHSRRNHGPSLALEL